MRASLARRTVHGAGSGLFRPLVAVAIFPVCLVAILPFFRTSAASFPPAHGSAERSSDPALNARSQAARLHLVPTAPLTANNTILAYPAPPVAARAAYLVDVQTGKVLYEKNPDARLPMASTTKITTAAVVLDHAHLTDMVTASKAAANIGESTMELRQGERLSVKDLLYGLLLNSGNDAAVALAEHVGGTQAHFVAMMNSLARRLHMTNTHYATPHGLDAPDHYTSAKDLATVALYAMRNAMFRRIVASTDYHIPKTKHNVEHFLGNINKALYWYPGVDGVKPGDTDAAGLCQVVTDWRNGHHVMAVLLHTPNLATDLRNLLNFGTRDFQWVPSIFAADGPTSTVSGGFGDSAWTYFYGAGHYVRGAFLHYFNTHGGLSTLGLPRTDQMLDARGYTVQYFQGAELVYDAFHDTAYPAPLGSQFAQAVTPYAVRAHPPAVAPALAPLFKQVGGPGVLGQAVTGPVRVQGVPVQFFQYGELAQAPSGPMMVPVGDAVLRRRGWLPAAGVGDWFPPTMSASAESLSSAGSTR